jgi:hypothetical protein
MKRRAVQSRADGYTLYMSSGLNPLRQWMHAKDVYVTYDRLEILKQRDGEEPEVISLSENGHVNWPAFALQIGGLLQYSAMESGIEQPSGLQPDLKKLAKQLRDQGDNGFILRSENMQLHYTVLEEIADAVTRQFHAGVDMAKSWGDMMAGMWGMENDAGKAWADMMKNSSNAQKKMAQQVFTVPLQKEMHLSEGAQVFA